MFMKPVPVKRKILERHVESHLRKRMLRLGGECYKWSSQNVRGVPDRICIFPNGQIWFVELKRDKRSKLSVLQKRFFERMAELNVSRITVLHGIEEVDAWFMELGF